MARVESFDAAQAIYCHLSDNSFDSWHGFVKGGGVSINKQKILDAEESPTTELLQGKYLLAQKGKKNYFLIKVV